MQKLYENIKNRRLELGLTQTQLAHKMGYADKSMIAKIEKGSVDLQQSKIIAFAKVLRIDPGELMGWDTPTPVYEVAAGEGIICDIPVEEINMSLEDNETVAYVRGHSMEPTLLDGDKAVVRLQPAPDYKNQICFVKINGEENTFKRVVVTDNGITLIADNTSVYPPHFFSAQEVEDLPVRIMGVVVRLVREIK